MVTVPAKMFLASHPSLQISDQPVPTIMQSNSLVSLHLYMCLYTYICTYICFKYINICVYVYIIIYIHRCIKPLYTYVCIYAHTHTGLNSVSLDNFTGKDRLKFLAYFRNESSGNRRKIFMGNKIQCLKNSGDVTACH